MSHPNAKRASEVGEGFGVTRGSVADLNSASKHKKYAALYTFKSKFLCPITFETNGCPSIATTAFLGAVKKYIMAHGSIHQKNIVGTCIKRLVIKVSAALTRSLGSAILDYRKGCQKGAGREGV